MSHYGYVSEQLLNGDLFPPRRGRRRSRRARRQEQRAAAQGQPADGGLERQSAPRNAPSGGRAIEVGVPRVADGRR